MMAGAPLDFPADMFGSCFRGEPQTLQAYSLGFRPYQDEQGATRAGPVTTGSPADTAGIRRYDIISNPDVLSTAPKVEPGEMITLDVIRDGAALTFELTPWTRPSTGLQWSRSEDAGPQCNL